MGGEGGRSAVLVGGCKLKWVCICVVSIKGVYKCFKCKRCACVIGLKDEYMCYKYNECL